MQVKRNSVLRWIALFFCLAACFFCFRVTTFAEETQSADDPAVVLNQETDNTAQQDAQTEAVSETEQNVSTAKTSTSTEASDADTIDTAAADTETANDTTEESDTAEATETENVEKGDRVYDTKNSFGYVYLGYASKDAVSKQQLFDMFLYYSYYKQGNVYVFTKSNNILVYAVPEGESPEDYNAFTTPYSELELDLTSEILKWGQEHGKNWTNETLVKDFTFDLKTGLYFYDENGNPIDFFDFSIPYAKPYINYWTYGYFTLTSDRKFDTTKNSVIFTAENNYWSLADENGFMSCPIQYLSSFGFIQEPSLVHFNPSYNGKPFRGLLNVEYRQEVLCTFEIDGQKYEILIHNPKDVTQFVVEDGIPTGKENTKSDADMNAEIKTKDQNGKTTIRSNSENETITGVVRGDQITYKINIDLSLEREMLQKLYQGIALYCNFDGNYSDEIRQIAKENNIALPMPYIFSYRLDTPNTEYTAFYPSITFTFTLPDDKDANGNYDLIVDEEALKNVQLIQEDGTPLWCLDPSQTKYDAEKRELTFVAYISPDQIVQDFIEIEENGVKKKVPHFDQEKAQALLDSMIGDQLTAVISGVRVSDLAEVGKPFTVKAKVSGSLDYKNGFELSLIGQPVSGAKPNPSGGFEDEDAGWDDEVSYQSARRAAKVFRAMASASEQESLYQPLNVSDYDLHQLLFGHFAWTHLQDPSTKDVIQTEDNSEEFWYTVIIPSLDITKEVKGINTDQEFNFELKLDDASLAGPFNGTTYNAELHENGTVKNVAVNFKNGVATFKLKNGQTIRIIVPFDTHFTLRETDHNGYFVTIDKNGNRILSDTLRGVIESYTSLEDIEANKNAYTFTNEYEEPERPEESKEENVEETKSTGVQTGMMTQTGMWMLLALASIVILHKQRA
ncbi:DUF7601 domain-containing protein [Catenisphaera adipataccumulans]|uniref:DUF7601 domain-containing protein n=1 Tax=Catenisphaera adipataccumulans TaxID=700500 RepID=A0A7W8FUY3_9FIRM|nr:hypothetical protein [Catenisphaera adipataccumulans]MBB5182573.1 hypothetical protein [Catenisphaera adipataccumulans]